MRPKGKLFALLVLVIAIGLVTATGAFSSVSATRDAQVNVAGDAAALLQVQPHSGPNGIDDGSPQASNGYAQLDSTNDQLEINLAGFSAGNDAPAGSGPNLNATTDIQGVFNITNQGSQQVWVNVSDDDESQSADGVVTFYNSSYADVGSQPYTGLEDTDGTAVLLEPGETLIVSIYVDTNMNDFGITLTDSDPLISEITIYANTDESAFTGAGVTTSSGPGGDT